ncbi:diguanylate cyclase [Paraburkholderia sp. Ac-20340]|uniref:sensor domain-containing diguanylate cyclase n=1 Tax=Paraburkholderia sp. Ac-20340 TaxID=2703888 RepID=UPI00197DB219|nr:diguanylate cyclase [Paraburkholderia sp. Ac-20340]MBN3857070.1 diguanylate cyclase [Paraburkholderia sp. Ac-20340]
MSELHNKPHKIVKYPAIGVAIVTRDDRGACIVISGNPSFFEQIQSVIRPLPVPVDTLLADARWDQCRNEFGEALRMVFSAANESSRTEPVCIRNHALRITLTPFQFANDGRTVTEVLVTTETTAAQPESTHQQTINASRYRAVVDSAYDAIVTIDQQHCITLFNRAAENLFGYSSTEIIGKRIETLLPEQFRANHSNNVRKFADSPLMEMRAMTPPRMDESNSVYGRHRNGSIIPVEIAISRIDVDGETEFTAVVRDITDRAQLLDRLKKQAVTDPLTGLPNRRECLEFVARMLGTSDAFSMFILDIDYFKEINDTYGHPVGDEVLCVLAKVGMSVTNEPILFARWGGEEFVAALPGADATRAYTVAQTLRQRIEAQDFEHTWLLKPIPFSVSIGVVTREPNEHDIEALIKRADRALYRAKKAGRNRVEAA